MKIIGIDKSSPLFGRVTVGADLVRVNRQPVADSIDFQFHSAEPALELDIVEQGKKRTIRMENAGCGNLGLAFAEGKIRICTNKCLFCFVHQQPKGMRRSLYLRDDDYRYSFTHGNFITLSGMSESDYQRIIAQRLSPLYISVHATDDKLRRCIFQNEKLEPILLRIRHLIKNGISLHTQTVVCPGLNDGARLEKTISDLAACAPGVMSLAVVPVGLTRYRDRLPRLRTFSPAESSEMIDLISKYQRQYQKELGTRFVFPADEFFLMAGKPLPPLSYYEEMPQFENGVGMARRFITDFNRRKRTLPKKLRKPLRLGIVTGRSAETFMQSEIIPTLAQIKGLSKEMTVVENRFWGKTVTVTGLLTGKDILHGLKSSKAEVVLLPPNCLNFDRLFLDDMSLETFTAKLRRPVLTGTYDIAALLRRAFELVES
jgi:putative radical SAM enzyme (TIGR03279 family)